MKCIGGRRYRRLPLIAAVICDICISLWNWLQYSLAAAAGEYMNLCNLRESYAIHREITFTTSPLFKLREEFPFEGIPYR
jgi:hypothetical protein